MYYNISVVLAFLNKRYLYDKPTEGRQMVGDALQGEVIAGSVCRALCKGVPDEVLVPLLRQWHTLMALVAEPCCDDDTEPVPLFGSNAMCRGSLAARLLEVGGFCYE